MDISGPKSELSEGWRVWLRGFTYFAEGKANLQNPARKRNEMLYRAGTGVQDIFENVVVVPLPEGQEDDVYQQAVRALNTHFHVQKNAVYERHVLRQLQQEPGEDVDSFVLRLRKQARHCGYGDEEVEFAGRDQMLEKVSSQELRTKLFEVPNIQLAAIIQYNASYWQLPARGFSVTIYHSRGNQIDIAQIAIYNCFLQIKSNQLLIFGERGKAEYPGRNLS